ncbi:MAG: pyridoxamine 5'-phosphate oxidase family protein [Anaerolineae bacterium]|nr:pyridoxamine 5'-phosphate oxidase family protein [Anaerolineae bacterium]
MAVIPESILQAWEQRQVPVILTTVDANGMPNAIYASSVSHFGEDRLVVADNYFDKTRANIFTGSKGSILFMTKDRKTYQVKGTLHYHTEGEVFEAMKSWNPARFPGHAAAVLVVEEIYSGSEKLL